jgi:hypothetical protein
MTLERVQLLADPPPLGIDRGLSWEIDYTWNWIWFEYSNATDTPAVFQIDWNTGPWQYRIWHQRRIRLRFPTFGGIGLVGSDTSGIGQDMTAYLELWKGDDTYFLKNSNDQPIWVEFRAGVGSPTNKAYWPLDPQQLKPFWAGEKPTIWLDVCEREHG